MAANCSLVTEASNGWRVSAIGKIADVTKLAGFEFTKHVEYDDAGEIIALRALNVRDGRLDLTSVKRIPKSVSESLPRSKLQKDDILLTYTGSLGEVALIVRAKLDRRQPTGLDPAIAALF